MSTEIPETQIATSEDEQIASILENMPVETEIDVHVPSGGKTDFGVKGGPVRIRPIKFGDERDVATGGRGPEFNAANHLLSKCTTNVDVDELLVVDKLHLLLKIREISYGNDYKVGVSCKECGYENQLNLQINQLPVENIPDDMDVFNIEVDLKTIKKKAVVSAPITSEERYLTDNIEKDLWRFIKSIDGNENRAVISKVIPKLPIADVHRIFNAVSLTGYGVLPQIRYTCDSCRADNLISLPIDENFFSVN